MAAQRRRAAVFDRRHHLELAETNMADVGTAPGGPWARKISATSTAGRDVTTVLYAGTSTSSSVHRWTCEMAWTIMGYSNLR